MRRFILAFLLSLTAFSAQALPVNLVVNGDFETGNFSGWTKSGNPSLSDVVSNTITSNHTFLWRVGATGTPAVISQSLATAVGGLYTLEFDLYNPSTNASTTSFSASFDGVSVFSTAGVAYNWVHFSFSGLQATTASTLLSFSGRNDPSFYRLDNVQVTAMPLPVPEPSGAALAALGVLVLGEVARRKRAARA